MQTQIQKKSDEEEIKRKLQILGAPHFIKNCGIFSQNAEYLKKYCFSLIGGIV